MVDGVGCLSLLSFSLLLPVGRVKLSQQRAWNRRRRLTKVVLELPRHVCLSSVAAGCSSVRPCDECVCWSVGTHVRGRCGFPPSLRTLAFLLRFVSVTRFVAVLLLRVLFSSLLRGCLRVCVCVFVCGSRSRWLFLVAPRVPRALAGRAATTHSLTSRRSGDQPQACAVLTQSRVIRDQQ